MEIEEVWKSIPNYEGKYEVSSEGNVKSLNFNNTKKEKLLKQYFCGKSKRRYLNVELSGKAFKVHKLVAMAFLKHIPNGHKEIVDHIDNNPTNNSINNLQLLSQRENCSKNSSREKDTPTGVFWAKWAKKWRVIIYIKGKCKHLGYFTDLNKASEVYQIKVKEINELEQNE